MSAKLGISVQMACFKILKRCLSLYSARSNSALILNKKPSVLNKLLEILNSKDAKLMEKAVTALGNIAYGDKDMEYSKQIVDGIFKLCENNSEELQLAIGQSLAKAASSNDLSDGFSVSFLELLSESESLEINSSLLSGLRFSKSPK